MITVAARDLPQGEDILRTCSAYMHQLVSELSAGKKCDVEAVEALLLLAEWEPQDSLSEAREVGCGEEDRAAWMHVGLALRIGYFLGLDRKKKILMLLQRRVDALNPYPNIAYQTGLVMGANKRFGPFMNSIAYIVKVLDLLGPRNSFGSNILVIRKTERMPKYLKAHTISPWVMD